MIEFNFDEWVELYKLDPIEFENKRQALLEAEIMKAPEEQRNSLRSLQLECDIVSLTNTPLDATIYMSKMMRDRADSLIIPITELKNIIKDIDK